MDKLHHVTFETSYGFAAIGWRSSKISSFRLPSRTIESAEISLLRRFPMSEPKAPPEFIRKVVRDVQRYFDGHRVDFFDAAIDLGEQDPLFERIYEFVRALNYGKTTTYGAIAKALGEDPQVARTVGEAMSRNPVPLIVPCHRVTASGGKIGGFSAPGGAHTKARMLALEGIVPAADEQHAFGF